MRARRKAALQAADAAEIALRPAGDLLEPAVRETLDALGLDGQDAAAAQLAVQMARTIDRCKDPSWGYRWLAPELLRILGELGGTPRARSKATQKRDPVRSAQASRIQELRAAHRKLPRPG
jgi:hypothetical protein